MSIDWNTPDLVFLKKQLQSGKVILFAGAGFSVDAKNSQDASPPLGASLAELLATAAGYTYSGEALPVVYEAAQKALGTHAMWDLLRKHYEITALADWYQIVRAITWNRIYTTNIDNLFQKLYGAGTGQRLRPLVNPAPVEERDTLFSELQCVHLHGSIDAPDKGMTFTLPEFGQMTATANPWYRSFVDDLYFRSVLFVGTQLEEPMFFHYLNLREPKERDAQEYRPRSYLVNRSIGAMRINNLRNRNIVGLECTGREFFESLRASIELESLTVNAVRAVAFPTAIFRGDKPVDEAINRYFEVVRADALPYTRKPPAEMFFMGAEPDWFDIAEQRDAFRSIVQELLDGLPLSRETFQMTVLHGPAGSGKTTTLMRVAERIAAAGAQVFYAKGNERLDLAGILAFAQEQVNADKRIFVFIDAFGRHLTSLDSNRERLKQSKNLTVVLADRSNKYAQVSHALVDLNPVDVRMPDLSEADAKAVIEKLARFGFLGELRNKPPEQQIAAFMERANKQMLVALREATSGLGFDVILRNEFGELARPAQLAYTICCMAVAHGAPGVYIRHLMPCLGRTEFRQGVIIKDLLRGILVPTNSSETLVKPRHRLIATWVANEIAPVGLKVEAVEKFLSQIAADIVPNEIKRRSPAYVAYRGMINSEAMKETFSNDSEVILDLYNQLKGHYDKDFLFWLQYGMAQINAGRLDLAENYLNQSLAIQPHSHQTKHHLGCLYLMQAARADNSAAAAERANNGISLLTEQIYSKGDVDSYPYHAYLVHVCRWYQRAGTIITQRQWERLRDLGREAERKYPRDDMIRAAVKEVERQYMMRAAVDA